VGYYIGTVDFDPGTNVFNLTSNGLEDIFIQKIDANGNFVWAKTIGGSQSDKNTLISVDSLGNVFLVGILNNGWIDIDPGPSTYFWTGQYGVFIEKLDPLGNYVWAKMSSMNAIGTSMTLDLLGNIYITGLFGQGIDFDPGPGYFMIPTTGGSNDIFILKLDGNGNFIWAKGVGGYFNESGGNAIVVDAIGDVYITGILLGGMDADPGANIFNLTSNGLNDIFILKLDINGNFIWAKAFGGSEDDNALSLAIDGLGNVFSTGYFRGTIDFDPGIGIFNLSSNGSTIPTTDIFIQKLDVNGNFVWAKVMGGASHEDQGISIKTDIYNNVYTTGYYSGVADFDPGSGTYNFTANGLQDIFIQKIDNNGNFIWAKSFGGINSDKSSSLILDASSNVIVSGNYSGTVDFDPGVGIFNITSNFNSNDGFIQKLIFCPLPNIPSNTSPSSNLTICSGNNSTLSASGIGILSWYSAPTGGIYLGSGTNFTTPVLSNNITYYVQDSTCVAGSRLAISITVNPIPTTLISASGPLTFCSNNPTYLTTSSASSYLWSNNATTQTIAPTQSGSYTVTITNALGCSNTSAPVVITVMPTSQMLLQPQNQNVNIGTNAQFYLVVTPQTTFYQWQQNAGLGFINLSNAGPYSGVNNDTIKISNVTSLLNNSLYRCIYTNLTNACSDTSDVVTLSVGSTEINELINNNIKIYPNPSNGQFNFAGLQKESIIEIYDVTGRLIYHSISQNTSESIDLSDKEKGIYFYKIISDTKEIQQGKIIVQ